MTCKTCQPLVKGKCPKCGDIKGCPTCPKTRLVQGQCPKCGYIKPYRSSASQVETAEECLRKWFLDKIEGLPRKPNRFARYGTVTHKILADWFDHKTTPPPTPEGRTALAILRKLPPPQTPGIEVEREINVVVGGVLFLGYVDFRILDLDVPFVSDHKTTSDLKWAKTKEELLTSVQPALYAHEALERTGRPAVKLQWTYGTRHKSPHVLPVINTVTAEDIAERMQKTAETAQLLNDLWHIRPDVEEVLYDANSCESYGGCPFKEICNLSPQERIRSIMTQEAKGNKFRERLQAAKAAKDAAKGTNGAAATAAAPTPPAEVPAESGTVNPPEAPTTAAAAPGPEPAKPPRKPRKTKEQRAAEKAAKAATKAATPAAVETPADAPAVAAAPAAAATPPAAPAVAAAAQTLSPALNMLIEQYAKGFKDGFALGRETD